MPTVAAAFLAFAAGVLAQGCGGGRTLAAALGVTIVLSVLGRRRVAAALVGLAMAGLLVASAEAASGIRCRSAALADSSWTVRLDGDVEPGKSARAAIIDGGCRVPAALSVSRGSASSGETALVAGRALPSDGAVEVRIVRAEVRRRGRADWLGRARARARMRVHTLFGSDDALPAALLLADREGLSPELRQRFADAGLVHILAISGLHVGLVAAALELVARALRMPRRLAGAAAALGALSYVALLGFPPAALRAGAMLGALALSRIIQRPTSPWALLALGAAAPLTFGVGVVSSLGYQLSVVGVAALIASGALARRWHAAAHLHGWRGALVRSLLASTLATAATGPIVAWHFGRLSLIGPIANVVAAPVIGFLQPLLFLALVLAPAAPAAALAADAARPVLRLLDTVAATAASAPAASVAVSPTLTSATLVGIAVAALLVACVAVFPARSLIVAALALSAAVWMPVVPAAHGELELHLIDVGQGDAIALRTPRGRWLLVDAGRVWRGGDAGRRTVLPYLRRRGGELVAFVLSHPHADHVGGAASVLHAMRPRQYWDAGYPAGGDAYRGSLAEAADHRVQWRRVHPGDSLVVDDVVVSFLAPDSAWAHSLRDANSASTIALVRYGAVRFLLTGDAEADEEAWLLDRFGGEALRADVLKVAHHGSRTGTTPAFLAAVRPRLALVSVGLDNDYGHPDLEVVRRLDQVGAQLLRTDQLGTIVVRTDGRRLDVDTREGRWSLPASSPR